MALTPTSCDFLLFYLFLNFPFNLLNDVAMVEGEDYRQEQIEIDEAKEKNMNLSSSVKAMRKKGQKESTSPNEAQGYSIRTSTVAAT
ncbi:hypothetical protein GOBAR_AA12443 [Gossypium barbadense]|uniref:Uncharacterized protein n=1 Tax=Gossypium barbadense TaxID=3634 RepID=A0A2P5XXZ2_GOSBA|nr:hypothetical protein GOBAR_AA12443 [Gossypium barbadense]